MRAPPESFKPIRGAPVLSARSMILTIFFALASQTPPADHREIRRENIGGPPLDEAVAGDESIAVNNLILHTEIAAAMAHQFVHFLESAFVEQQVDALARREFSFLVLPHPPRFAAAGFGVGMAPPQFLEPIGHKRLFMIAHNRTQRQCSSLFCALAGNVIPRRIVPCSCPALFSAVWVCSSRPLWF